MLANARRAGRERPSGCVTASRSLAHAACDKRNERGVLYPARTKRSWGSKTNNTQSAPPHFEQGGELRRFFRFRRCRLEAVGQFDQRPDMFKRNPAGRTEEAVVPHFHESCRQDLLEKTPHELHDFKFQDTPAIAAGFLVSNEKRFGFLFSRSCCSTRPRGRHMRNLGPYYIYRILSPESKKAGVRV